MKTVSGTWVNGNSFVLDNGERIFIAPYGKILDEVKSLFPLNCYVQLRGIIAKDYVIKN